jgi:hypothetical protein
MPFFANMSGWELSAITARHPGYGRITRTLTSDSVMLATKPDESMKPLPHGALQCTKAQTTP